MSDFLGLHPIGLPTGGGTGGTSLTAAQLAALNGTSGAPSGANPFVTSTDVRLLPQTIPASPGTYLVSGANISWVTGFQFSVSAASYYIDGTAYTSALQTVTLTAADVTNDRIDVLTLNTSGIAGKVTGTAASSPAEPTVDQTTLLGLGIVYVTANATSPGVTTTSIYTENAEWTGSASAGTIVTNSASAPRTGTLCVVGTAVTAGTTLTFTKPSTNVDLAQYGILVMYVKITAAWPATKSITCRWLAGAATVGVDVPVGDGQYGLNTQVIGTYQQVVVPLATFAVPAGTAVTKLRLTFAGTGTVGFSMDDISIQTGTGTSASPSQFNYRGTWVTSGNYAKNDVVALSGGTYLALQANTAQSPLTATAYWVVLGYTTAIGQTYMYPYWDVTTDPINDNFSGAAIDTAGTRYSGAAAWTSINIGASTVTQSAKRLWLTSPASASLQIRGYHVAVPSGNWCIRMAVAIRTANVTTECSVGMFLYDSVGGKIETWAISFASANGQLWAGKYTNSTTYSATRQATTLTGPSLPSLLEIEYDGTNYYLRAGYTEASMNQANSTYVFAKTNFLAAAADRIGVFSENDTSVPTTLICSGFWRAPVSSVVW